MQTYRSDETEINSGDENEICDLKKLKEKWEKAIRRYTKLCTKNAMVNKLTS